MATNSSLESSKDQEPQQNEDLILSLEQRMKKVQQRSILISKTRQNHCAKKSRNNTTTPEPNVLVLEQSEDVLRLQLGKTREYLYNINKISKKSHETRRKNFNLEALTPNLDLKSNTIHTVLKTIKCYRDIMSQPSSIDKVILSGAVPFIVQYLDTDEVQKHFSINSFNSAVLQLEATLAIHNISLGTTQQIKYLVDIGCISRLVNNIESVHDFEYLRDESILALGNICGDSVLFRDVALSHGAISKVINILEFSSSDSLRVSASFLLLNLLRELPAPPLENFTMAIPVLAKILFTCSNTNLLFNICSCILFGFECSNDIIQASIENGAMRKVIELLTFSSSGIQGCTVKAMCSLSYRGTDQQISQVLQYGLLDKLAQFLDFRTKFKKEAVSTLANIVAGPPEHIQMVIDSNIISKIQYILNSGTEDEKVNTEGYWFFVNLFQKANTEQIRYLVKKGFIRLLCEALREVTDTQINEHALVSFKCVMVAVKEEPELLEIVTDYLQEYGGSQGILE